MNGSTLAWVAEAGANNERNGTRPRSDRRKVAERSVALECNVEKRKPPAAGFGRKTIHGLHLRRVEGLFVVLSGDNVD